MDGATFNNLTSIIVQSLVGFEGMTKIDMVNKLMHFGANGSTIFQGVKMSVTTQLVQKHIPFVSNVNKFHKLGCLNFEWFEVDGQD
jgi:hypothetical protein